jgi:hypothetical protein
MSIGGQVITDLTNCAFQFRHSIDNAIGTAVDFVAVVAGSEQ